jgi:hypothetical protein
MSNNIRYRWDDEKKAERFEYVNEDGRVIMSGETGRIAPEPFRTPEEIELSLVSPCHKHKKYRGKKVPSQNCLSCWLIYFSRRFDKPVTGHEMREIIMALRNHISEEQDRTERHVRDNIAARLADDYGDCY